MLPDLGEPQLTRGVLTNEGTFTDRSGLGKTQTCGAKKTFTIIPVPLQRGRGTDGHLGLPTGAPCQHPAQRRRGVAVEVPVQQFHSAKSCFVRAPADKPVFWSYAIPESSR